VAPTTLYAASTPKAFASWRFNDLTISIALTRPFLPISKIMRLVVEIVIIAAVIFIGWNKPFKAQVDQAYATIESTLNRSGSKLQKNQDPSVKRY
jgi:hypothetical protein